MCVCVCVCVCVSGQDFALYKHFHDDVPRPPPLPPRHRPHYYYYVKKYCSCTLIFSDVNNYYINYVSEVVLPFQPMVLLMLVGLLPCHVT